MLNIKRIDHVLNTTVYSMTNTVPLIHLVKYRQLKFLGHILRMSKEEPARRYLLYIPTIGKSRPGRPRTSYLNYVQRLLGDYEGAMQEQQITAFADDRRAWRNLVVACSAADGWWWMPGNIFKQFCLINDQLLVWSLLKNQLINRSTSLTTFQSILFPKWPPKCNKCIKYDIFPHFCLIMNTILLQC